MPLKQDIYSRQKIRLGSYSMCREFAVLTILFLVSSQIFHSSANAENRQSTPQCTVCEEMDTLCVWSDANDKTQLESCEHCPVFLLADRQYVGQLPVNYDGQKLSEFTQAEFFLMQAITSEHLRPYRLNSRGPPHSGILIGFPARTIPPAQNAIDAISLKIGGAQWR